MNDDLIASLTAAVEAAPGDVALRVHLAELLVAAGRREDAVRHAAAALSVDPGSEAARAAMTRAMSQEPTAGGGVAEAPTDHDESAQEGFDWSSAERDLGDVVPPMFADGSTDDGDGASPRAFDVEREQVRLADVGGLDDV